jgi:hypothetical protein
MALFAPIPRARVMMAMRLKPGDFRSMESVAEIIHKREVKREARFVNRPM